MPSNLADILKPLDEPLPDLTHDEIGSAIELLRRLKGGKLRSIEVERSLRDGQLVFQFTHQYKALP